MVAPVCVPLSATRWRSVLMLDRRTNSEVFVRKSEQVARDQPSLTPGISNGYDVFLHKEEKSSCVMAAEFIKRPNY